MGLNREQDLCELEQVCGITKGDFIKQGYKYLGFSSSNKG